MAVLEFLLSAILMAFGLLILFMLFQAEVGDKKAVLLLILGLLAFFGGAYIIVAIVGLFTLLKKLIGIVILFIGLFFIIGFPSNTAEQDPRRGYFGILLGLILTFLGLFLVLF